SLGLALGAFRARMQSGWSGAMLLCAIACAAALVSTGSKGAAMASLVGLALAGAPLLWLKSAQILAARLGGAGLPIPIRRNWGPLIIAMVLLPLAAVVLRGTALPEGFAGDKSLLFRWHYLQASAHIAAEHPWVGVGPDGFQDAYVRHR